LIAGKLAMTVTFHSINVIRNSHVSLSNRTPGHLSAGSVQVHKCAPNNVSVHCGCEDAVESSFPIFPKFSTTFSQAQNVGIVSFFNFAAGHSEVGSQGLSKSDCVNSCDAGFFISNAHGSDSLSFLATYMYPSACAYCLADCICIFSA
jgi:hypothetical protein